MEIIATPADKPLLNKLKPALNNVKVPNIPNRISMSFAIFSRCKLSRSDNADTIILTAVAIDISAIEPFEMLLPVFAIT